MLTCAHLHEMPNFFSRFLYKIYQENDKYLYKWEKAVSQTHLHIRPGRFYMKNKSKSKKDYNKMYERVSIALNSKNNQVHNEASAIVNIIKSDKFHYGNVVDFVANAIIEKAERDNIKKK